MILEGAPVTGLTLLISTVSSAVVRGQYTRYRSLTFPPGTPAAPLTRVTLVKRLFLESIPAGPLGTSAMDILLAVNLLYQFRTLERRWGPSSYMAFVLTSAMLGVCAVQLFITESGSTQLSVDAVRILSAVGMLVPLSALLTRYLREVPSRSPLGLRIPGTNTHVSGKVLTLLPLLKLVLIPSTQLQAQTFRWAAVEADVGVWMRVLFVICGAVFALVSAHSIAVQWWLSIFRRYVCRPLLYFLQPVTDVLFGGSLTVDHAKPRGAQNRTRGSATFEAGVGGARGGAGDAGGAGVIDGGRYVVESLTGDDTLQAVGARMRARRREAQRHPLRPSQGGPVAAGGASSAWHLSPQAEAARNEAVMAVEAIGLDVTRDEIIAALDMAEGNQEMAVQILLGS